VRLLTVAKGEIGELNIGFKGTMNALFLRDLAAKIRRGQRGRAAEGLIPGGRGYGYEVVRELDAKGELLHGRPRVLEAEGDVIRRIFGEYVAGRSARAIAARLNRDGIPSPTGKAWGAGTINGSRSRSSGILYNEAYIGRLVYNRTSFSKNPETGRRVLRPLPTADRVVTTVADRRIVSDKFLHTSCVRKDIEDARARAVLTVGEVSGLQARLIRALPGRAEVSTFVEGKSQRLSRCSSRPSRRWRCSAIPSWFGRTVIPNSRER
jgi:site-specific DNA recombinase